MVYESVLFVSLSKHTTKFGTQSWNVVMVYGPTFGSLVPEHRTKFENKQTDPELCDSIMCQHYN